MANLNTCGQCSQPIASELFGAVCPRCLLADVVSADKAVPRHASVTPPTEDEVAELFPQFEMIDFLGSGGMGSVYLVEQPVIERLAALKVLPRELATNEGIGFRFENEARVMAQLQHSNIVALYEHGRSEDGMLYLLMEFVDGGDLRQLLDCGPMDRDEAVRLTDEVCEALQYAHDAGVTHRDIKPSNILLTRDRQVKLGDFGLARLLRDQKVDMQLTLTGDVLGTFDYVAPEQRDGNEADGRADIYSLGVTLYEMLTGKLPRISYQAPSTFGQRNRALDRVVTKALAGEPEDRFESPRQLATALAASISPRTYLTYWKTSTFVFGILALVLFLTQPWKPKPLKGVIWEDTFTEPGEKWNILQMRGKAMDQRDGKMVWDTQGTDIGRASMVLLTDLFIEPEGHYRIEYDLGEFKVIEGPNIDYSIYFGLVGADYDRANVSPWVQTEPLITLSLIADALAGINMVAAYKDGSGEGLNGLNSNGSFTNTCYLPDWDGQAFRSFWIEIHQGKIQGGWSGGDQVVAWSKSNPEFNFAEPDIRDFTGPLRVFMIGLNGAISKGTHGRGGHACRRITVQRLD